MNFQKLVDNFYAPTCVISVEKIPDGGYGEIRIVTGNQKYLEPFEHPVYSHNSTPIAENKFVPNSLYEKYVPKDLGFEDICYRASVQKKPLHTYVHLSYINLWFDIFAMPVEYEEGNLCYCIYTAIPCSANEVSLSSGNSGRAYEDVLKTCIKLHQTDDMKKIMQEVVHDIRFICKADVCSILLQNDYDGTFSDLTTSFDKNNPLKRVTQFVNFNDITASWVDTIGDKECVIIKNEENMEYISKVNPLWYGTLKEAGVASVIMFPLRYEREILGFMWATNFDTQNTVPIRETLELTTFFISSQLSRYKMMKRLRHISYTDRLTGLPNRFACYELIKELIQQGNPFTVVSIDINNFKSINNTMGLDAGNDVLIEIAFRWKMIADSRNSGTLDFVARLGGDEFALVIRDYDSNQTVIQTIRQYEAVLGKCLTVDECDFYITASFGYAEFPFDANTRNNLLIDADTAMHEVKRANSSNHILRFTPDMLKMERTLEVERKIRIALENDTIYFNLQPQYDMFHKLRGFEALARMRDEKGNFISPAEFIPAAEKVGLIDKVDGTVFRKSAVFFGELLRKSGIDMTLSINVSVRHLMKNDFLEEIRSLLELSRIPPQQLEIEITESIMIDSAEKALHCINDIRSMGIKLAIDDFGTGYSSLSYLNHFPANLLKIDKSFIDEMEKSESSRQYVSAIISMGHIMGFDVIAEGVEHSEQLETLRNIGCDFVQGFIWGRPLPEEEAEKLVMNICGEK